MAIMLSGGGVSSALFITIGVLFTKDISHAVQNSSKQKRPVKVVIEDGVQQLVGFSQYFPDRMWNPLCSNRAEPNQNNPVCVHCMVSILLQSLLLDSRFGSHQ